MLGEYLDKKLKEKGWSKNYFAQRCGIAVSSVSRIINGHQSNLTVKMKEKIATGLGMSLEEMERSSRESSLQSMIDEMERLSDSLSSVMTARERNQVLSILQRARGRAEDNDPPAAP